MGKKSKRKSMRNKVRGRAQERESATGLPWLSTGDSVEMFQPKKGRNKFDILPYEVTVDNHPEQEAGELWYQRTVWVHYGIGAEEQTVICPLKTNGDKCPICEHRASLMRDPDGDEDIIKDLKPRERELFNIFDYDDDEIKLWQYSYHNFGKQLEEEILESGEDEDYAGHADLEDGYTLKVRFSQKKLGTNKFLEASRIDFIERDDYDESILDDVQNLDEILVVLSYRELKDMFFEMEKDEDEDGEEEEKSSRKSRRGKKSGKKKSSKKKSGKKSRRGKKKDEDEDGDGDEPEEDEPEEDPEDEDGDSDGDGDEECPEGYEFGTDCNDHDECDDCNMWEACQDAQDAMEEEDKEDKKSSKKKSGKKSGKKKSGRKRRGKK